MIPAGCVQACPGCKQRELSAEESAAQKQGWVERKLETVRPLIQPIVVPQKRWGYRRKATLHARLAADGWRFGLIQFRDRAEIFIPIPECPVHSEDLNKIFAACKDLPRNIPLAFVQVSGKAVTLVLKSAREEELLAQLRRFFPQLERAGVISLFVNWHAAAGRRVLSSRHMERIAGPEFLPEGGFLHGPTAFRQQIAELEEQAHALAENHLGALPKIIDLYCGLGISLARWRKSGRIAIGVELVGEACALAALNAPGAEILKGKVEERIPQIDITGEFGIYTNPPREGQGHLVSAWMNRSGATRIAYLSCNMRSLSEDLETLPNYRVQKVQAFDFFPQTDHVEALVLLERIQRD